jgi:hypothetical protein
MKNDEKIIELSKTKLLLLIAGALIFVALGIWMYQLDPAWIEAQRRFNSPAIVHGIGIASIVFFGACGAAGLKKSFDKKPGLVLSAAGIVDNSSAVSAGLIPWSDIQGFGIHEIQKQRLLIIMLADPEKYIRAGGSMKQALHRMNTRICGSPIAISSNALKINFDELVGLCNSYHTKYGRTATPEMVREAKNNPGGWVYAISGKFGPNDAVPPEAIAGAWKVDDQGRIIQGSFKPNPNYQGKSQ